MKVGTAIVILEWVGTFFLAIEAIKLHNLAIIREQMRNVGWRFHPITNLIADSPDVASAEKRAGTLINVWIMTGMLSLGWLFSLTKLDARQLIDSAATLLPNFPYRSEVTFLILACIGLAFAMFVGYVLFRAALLFLALVVRGLAALERNTANGVAGVLGFFLFSAAAILKLSGFDH